MNFKQTKSIFWMTGIVSAALLFGGCGGGSGSGSDTIASNPSAEESQPTGNSGIQPAASHATGLFIDAAAVANLTYSCDGKTAQTDAQGGFACAQMPVTFSIGKITLGKLESLPNADAAVFSQNTLGLPSIATRHPMAVKLSAFLAILDDDGDLSNGIRISADSVDIINTAIDTQTAFEQLDDAVLQNIREQIVDANMNRAPAYHYTQPSSDEITRDLSIAVAKTYQIK